MLSQEGSMYVYVYTLEIVRVMMLVRYHRNAKQRTERPHTSAGWNFVTSGHTNDEMPTLMLWSRTGARWVQHSDLSTDTATKCIAMQCIACGH